VDGLEDVFGANMGVRERGEQEQDAEARQDAAETG
jgi:hypothetical protein